MIIHQCPDCSGVLTEQGIIWQCDGYHPEVLAQLAQQDQQEQRSTEDNRDEKQ